MNLNIKSMLQRYGEVKIKEQTKVREIIQQTALLGLERRGFFEQAAFYGGTALRILYGLDRFSEDLDFTLLKKNPSFNFKLFLDGMIEELASFGFEMEVSVKEKTITTNIESAFLKGNTRKIYLAIREDSKAVSNEKIQIKIEVDVDPPNPFRLEQKVVMNPLPFNVLTLHLSDLFAGKMHAILYRSWQGRVKGRDWYDLLWYLRHEIPLSLEHLEIRMKQTGHLGENEFINRENLLKRLSERIETIDWESAKNDMNAFIADTSSLKLWSAPFFLSVIQRIKIE